MGYVIGILINGIIFGFITKYVAESKGYEGGFWWGFWLGLIGLLVVGFRPNVRSNTSYSNYQSVSNSDYDYQSQTSRTVEPIAEKEVKKWTCIKCRTENPEKSKFCCECGEPRHFDWKCGNCGEINEAKVKFCYNCGKEKGILEEIIPETSLDVVDSNDKEAIKTDITDINDFQIRCNNCGAIQRNTRTICFRCGAEFIKD